MKQTDALLIQNARFYEAFERADLPALEAIWSHQPTVKCIHPGSVAMLGWEEVRRSWESIFSSGVSMKFTLRNVVAEVRGDLGIVVLIEEVAYREGITLQTGSIVATNLFEHDGKEWKMIHHHGSPLVGEEEGGETGHLYN